MSKPNSAFEGLSLKHCRIHSQHDPTCPDCKIKTLLDAYAEVVAERDAARQFYEDCESATAQTNETIEKMESDLAKYEQIQKLYESDLAATHQLRRDEVASLIDKHNKMVEENERLREAIRSQRHSTGRICRWNAGPLYVLEQDTNDCTPENCIWLQVQKPEEERT